MRERPSLARMLGVRDLIIGTGLLLDWRPALWMAVRALSDSSDTMMMLAGARWLNFHGARALAAAAVAGGLALYSIALWQTLWGPKAR